MKPFVLFVFAACTCSAFESDFSIRPEGDSVMIRGSNGNTATVRAAKLFYKGEEGTLPTQEDYLVEIVNNSYPRIVDMLDGRISKIQLLDVAENNGNELLVYYFAGGNQYGVRVYTIDGIEVKPLKSQPVSSNMRSVEVKGKEIVVKNQERDAKGVRQISTTKYQVVGSDCKLVREEKTTGSK